MEKVDVGDLDSRMGPADEKRPVSRALEATDLALNYYELGPGDSFAFGYHSHADQEEVFYIQEGTVTFETEDGEVTASAGECVRFAPGEWQQGRNEGEDRVVALAIGAPQDSGETVILRECPDCGERTEQDLELADGREAILAVCLDCGAETGRFT